MAEASAEERGDSRLLTALVAVAAFMGSLDASTVNVFLGGGALAYFRDRHYTLANTRALVGMFLLTGGLVQAT